MKRQAWHSLEIQAVRAALKLPESGLSTEHARARLAESGMNELPMADTVSPWRILAEQFQNLLIIILLIAVVMSAFLGEVLEAIDLAKIRSNGYVFLIEMSFLAWCKGFRLGEIPIIFKERRVGQSKISKSIIWESIWVVFKLRLLKMFGRL